MKNIINIDDFAYDLPDDRIAKYPLEEREASKLLYYNGNTIQSDLFNNISERLPKDALLVFNNTKVVRARLIFHKPTGARIEIFCLEPLSPPSYEQALATKGNTTWHCIVGNAKKFNTPIEMAGGMLRAEKGEGDAVNFKWSEDISFGELLEKLGRVPIPPYLNRDSEAIDTERYQTTYAKIEGSVAAPTAGLHFSQKVLDELSEKGFQKAELTLHVGAGTFLPVKESDATKHVMHTETFDVRLSELKKLAENEGRLVAIGTTSVRTLESLAVIGGRVAENGDPQFEKTVGQWEHYDQKSLKPLLQYMSDNNLENICGSTQIMITPGFRFVTIEGLVTNFHQPKSTLLLLISAIVGERWRDIYEYALAHDYRFLSYGDSSLLMKNNDKIHNF